MAAPGTSSLLGVILVLLMGSMHHLPTHELTRAALALGLCPLWAVWTFAWQCQPLLDSALIHTFL